MKRFLPAIVTIVALLGFGALILWRNGGTFVYSLDDPYIHLALARHMAHGHYGINAGEFSAPSSSVLWPILLIPFASWDFGALWPMVICGASAIATAVLVSRRMTWTWAVLFVIATNLPGLAFTGMEHSLHVLFATIAALGLWDFSDRGTVSRWWMAALIIGPLIRYESLGITIPILLFLWFKGKRGPALLGLALTILPLLAFSVFLKSLGLAALPNSVLAKDAAGTGNFALTTAKNLYHNLVQHPVESVSIVSMMVLIAWKRTPVAWVFAVCGAIHLVFGRFGWMARYECYIVAFEFVGLYAVWEGKLPRAWPFLFVPAAFYAVEASKTPYWSHQIYQQQYQMGRFAREWNAPVAINDLGLVSWENRNYVLDLFGLASREAMDHRKNRDDIRWMDRMAEAKNVHLAMIYGHWFPVVPGGWTHIATLKRLGDVPLKGDDEVLFYAIGDGGDVAKAKLRSFAPKLPSDTELVIQ